LSRCSLHETAEGAGAISTGRRKFIGDVIGVPLTALKRTDAILPIAVNCTVTSLKVLKPLTTIFSMKLVVYDVRGTPLVPRYKKSTPTVSLPSIVSTFRVVVLKAVVLIFDVDIKGEVTLAAETVPVTARLLSKVTFPLP